MAYKTLDGFDLQEGDTCFISLQCLTGEHRVSSNPRPAIYMDDNAKIHGWDFTIKRHRKTETMDCDDCACEVCAVWKNKPVKPEVKNETH